MLEGKYIPVLLPKRPMASKSGLHPLIRSVNQGFTKRQKTIILKLLHKGDKDDSR